MGTSDGKWTVIKQGEVIVQLGAQHQWENRSAEWCRKSGLGAGWRPVRTRVGGWAFGRCVLTSSWVVTVWLCRDYVCGDRG